MDNNIKFITGGDYDEVFMTFQNLLLSSINKYFPFKSVTGVYDTEGIVDLSFDNGITIKGQIDCEPHTVKISIGANQYDIDIHPYDGMGSFNNVEFEKSLKTLYQFSPNNNQYNVFLLIELARFHNIIDPQLETDLTWEQGQAMYKEFEGRAFDVPHLGLGECLMQFLQTKLDPKQDLIDRVIEEIKKDVNSGDLTAVEGMLQLVPVEILKDYLPE